MNKFFDDESTTQKERKLERKLLSRKDRSKHKKTDKEKREKALLSEREKKLQKKDFFRGRVLAIHAHGLSVQHENLVYLCTLRGELKKEITKIKNLVTVGDFVFFDPKEGTIFQIDQRYSFLSRKEHLNQKQEQLIAANIDQVLITASIAEPPLKPALVDRYIIATYKGGMQPVILINKIDLLQDKEDEKILLEQFLQIYASLGITVIPISVVSNEGIEALKGQMKDKASVFSGQSGVGKSSLINAVAGLALPTKEIIRKTKKGAHTTSSAQLLPLAFGGWCIDTPGIRSFGIWDLKIEDLELYFPEISELGKTCKFKNCSHTHEPDCTVRDAAFHGVIPKLRFDSYLKLLDEISI